MKCWCETEILDRVPLRIRELARRMSQENIPQE